MSDMTNADMAAYHKVQAKVSHDRAQRARKHALECKERRDFLGKLKADMQAREHRETRDSHKAKAKQYAALA